MKSLINVRFKQMVHLRVSLGMCLALFSVPVPWRVVRVETMSRLDLGFWRGTLQAMRARFPAVQGNRVCAWQPVWWSDVEWQGKIDWLMFNFVLILLSGKFDDVLFLRASFMFRHTLDIHMFSFFGFTCCDSQVNFSCGKMIGSKR